ncbi:gem-associated protein 2 isoform X1 [Nerophis ophidion]|uniref:gem-associated protein 2 isoform X1 n=1 Tax=Nerophis ophidion TaxID=159077 RepID=UPI002ADFEE0B|nr:gem-associated protein 2 isoform X1 [Nerophis ophidion]
MKSDVEDLMPRLLPVEYEDSSADLKLDGPPRNPQEYLRQVQLEAALCPEVVVAEIDPKKLTKQQTVNASLAGCPAAPAGCCPSLSWQQRQVANFSDVRQSITKNRQHWSSHSLDDNVSMPDKRDEEGWTRFCLGELAYQDLLSSNAGAVTGLNYSKVGFPPFLSIVSRLSQSEVLSVLEILGGWFEEQLFVPQLGRWLFALLACLEKPLLPEAHSCIRQLARRCAQVRSALESQDDDNLPALNLLICLVARYFEQNDLADQPE